MSINNTHLIENDMTYLLLIMYIKRHIEVVSSCHYSMKSSSDWHLR